MGDWREVSKCEKLDFKNADIRQCPCDYSDRIIPHEEIISGKSLRSLQFNIEPPLNLACQL